MSSAGDAGEFFAGGGDAVRTVRCAADDEARRLEDMKDHEDSFEIWMPCRAGWGIFSAKQDIAERANIPTMFSDVQLFVAGFLRPFFIVGRTLPCENFLYSL